MFDRNIFLAIAGLAAIAAGIALFVSEANIAHWILWIAGILLWFVGCALVIGWAAGRVYAAGWNQHKEKPRHLKKAS
jgi:membrane-bound ClpP family serine protease